MRSIAVVAFLAVVLLPGRALANGNFNVSVTFSPQLAYVVDGQTEPTLQLVRGQIYTFTLDSSVSGHPFHIKTVGGVTGSTDDLPTGVMNNGVDNGVVTLTVPSSGQNTLFYQCGIHNFMTGSLQLVALAPPPVPATRAPAVFLLALILGASGWLAGHRLRRGRPA
jgi:hypothetical protein